MAKKIRKKKIKAAGMGKQEQRMAEAKKAIESMKVLNPWVFIKSYKNGVRVNYMGEEMTSGRYSDFFSSIGDTIKSVITGGNKNKKNVDKIVSGKNPGSQGWIEANRFNQARGGFVGGWGAIAFKNIVDAHSSAEEIVSEFELGNEHNPYDTTPYEEAYAWGYEEAYARYEEDVGYYMEYIELCDSEIAERESEIEGYESDIEDLEMEIEALYDEAELCIMCEDWDGAEDCYELAEELQEIVDTLLEMIDLLKDEILMYQEERDMAYQEIEALVFEDYIDYEEIQKRADENALVIARSWIDGQEWIPIEVLDWAYYDVSDHNR